MTPTRRHDNLYRSGEIALRELPGVSAPVLHGHFAVFDTPTEIDSLYEGRFIEQIAPGAFRKTFKENRSQIRALFQHGFDPQVGDKPLGPIRELREDETGAWYEVELLDTDYNSELLPGLRAGLYGASFRFRVIREDWDERPEASGDNPDGLPVRTIREAKVYEMGPVTFGAYPEATSMVRSLTDEFAPDRLKRAESSIIVPREVPRDVASLDKSFDEPVEDTEESQDAPPDQDEAPAPDDEPVEVAPLSTGEAAAAVTTEARDQKETDNMETYRTKAEIVARQAEVQSRLEEIGKEHGAAVLPDETQREFDELGDEKKALAAQLDAFEKREAIIGDRAVNGEKPTEDTPKGVVRGSNLPDDLFNLDEYRLRARSVEEHRSLLRDGTLKLVEQMALPHERADRNKVEKHIERLLAGSTYCDPAAVAQHIIATTSPRYVRAFERVLQRKPLTSEEARAMSLTDNAGGYAVPAFLDPTVIPTSDGSINPLRQIARVETITGDVWKGVSSDGVTAAYRSEAAQASDGAPAFAGPEITPGAADCWIPFSYEIGMDFPGIAQELARMLADAKDDLEADKFVTGDGNPPTPEGVVAGLGLQSHVTSETVNGFEVADLYHLKNALPPRFRGRARFLANDSFYSEIRQLDTSGGASLWTQLGSDTPAVLLGKPAHEASNMAGTSVSGDDVLLYGDFSYYCIVDRIGLTMRYVDVVVGANQRPTGQAGWYAFWRNGAEILSDNAFRLLTIGLTS